MFFVPEEEGVAGLFSKVPFSKKEKIMRKRLMICGALLACMVLGSCVVQDDQLATASGAVDEENFEEHPAYTDDADEDVTRSLDVDPENEYSGAGIEDSIMAMPMIVESGSIAPENEV